MLFNSLIIVFAIMFVIGIITVLVGFFKETKIIIILGFVIFILVGGSLLSTTVIMAHEYNQRYQARIKTTKTKLAVN